MNDLGFQIGKELGELKARLDQLEGKKDCGCKGKFVAPRQPACSNTQAAFKKLISALAELQAAKDGEKLYIKSVVFTKNSERAATTTDDICCCYASNGDYCCGQCTDPYCSWYCSNN